MSALGIAAVFLENGLWTRNVLDPSAQQIISKAAQFFIPANGWQFAALCERQILLTAENAGQMSRKRRDRQLEAQTTLLEKQ